MTVTAILAFAAVYLIWGSSYFAIAIGIETLPPFALAATRFLVAGLLLYAYARLRGVARPTLVQWRETTIIGTLLLCGGNGLVCWSETHIPSGSAALFIALVPIFMVLLDVYWARKSSLDPLTVAGVVTGFLGIVLLVSAGSGESSHHHLGGAAALTCAALLWSIGSIRARSVPLPQSTLLTNAMEMIGGSFALVVVSLATGEASAIHLETVSMKSVWALGYLIVFGSIVALTAYAWLLKNFSVASVSTYAFVNPVVALFIGWLGANETVNGGTAGAAALVILGVVLIHRARTTRAANTARLIAAGQET